MVLSKPVLLKMKSFSIYFLIYEVESDWKLTMNTYCSPSHCRYTIHESKLCYFIVYLLSSFFLCHFSYAFQFGDWPVVLLPFMIFLKVGNRHTSIFSLVGRVLLKNLCLCSARLKWLLAVMQECYVILLQFC